MILFFNLFFYVSQISLSDRQFVKRFAEVAPALVVSFGVVLSLYSFIADLSLPWAGSIILLFSALFGCGGIRSFLLFLCGILVSVSCLSFLFHLPPKNAASQGIIQLEVLGEFQSDQRSFGPKKYRIFVREFTSQHDRYFGFYASLRAPKKEQLALDCVYMAEGSLYRSDRGIQIRLKDHTCSLVSQNLIPSTSWRNYLRDYCLMRSAKLYPPSEERDFLEVLTLGGQLSQFRRAQLNRFGLDHIAAVSGFHFGIVMGFAWWISRVLMGGFYSRFCVMGALTFYAFLVGPQASVLRAFFTSLLFIAAPLVDRRSNGLNNLGIAAVVLLFANPFFLLSPGFQLSFSATLGILLLYKPLSNAVCDIELFKIEKENKKNRLSEWFWKMSCVSFSAMLFALPIQISHFSMLSLWGLLFNLFIPFYVGIMILMYISSVLLPYFFGDIASKCTYEMARFILILLDAVPSSPLGIVFFDISQIVVIGLFIFLIGASIFIWSRTEKEESSVLPYGI